MELMIDTTQKDKIILAMVGNGFKPFPTGKEIKKRKVIKATQISERLLVEIEKFLKAEGAKLSDLRKILVNPGPGGFSSVRSGVAAANALAYALNISVAEYPGGRVKEIVLPRYAKAPNITKPRKHFE